MFPNLFFNRSKVLYLNLSWLLNRYLRCNNIDKHFTANVFRYVLLKYKNSIKWNPIKQILLSRECLNEIVPLNNTTNVLSPYTIERLDVMFDKVIYNHDDFKIIFLNSLPSYS